MSIIREALSVLDGAGRRGALGLLMLLILGAILEAVSAALIVPFIALISDPSYLTKETWVGRLFDVSGFSTSAHFIVACSLGLFLFFVGKNSYLALVTSIQYRFIYSRMASTSVQLFSVYLHNSYTFHIRQNTAFLIRDVSNEVLMFFTNVLVPGFIVITELLVIVAMATVLFVMFPAPALIAVASLGLSAALFHWFVRKRVALYGALQQRENGDRLKWINQGLGGIKEIKVRGCEDYFVEAFSRHETRFAQTTRYAMVLNQMPRLFIETIAVGALFLSIALAVTTTNDIRVVLPTIGLFAMAAFRLLPSFNRITTSIGRIAYYRSAADVIYRGLNVSRTESIPESSSGAMPFEFRDKIEFIGTTYRYPNANKSSIKDISFTIPKGTSVALIGPSGAGKTTLVDVLLGLLEPTQGRVLVDGVDIKTNLRAWQSRVGYIPQTIYLSDDTIRRNVAFGVPDNCIDDEAVWNALRMSQLYDHIQILPNKLDTPVGERGINLSGGQRQRIGIARALYRDPDLIVLDEATSALDTETEQEISRAIDALAGTKTLVIIAHRLSTVEKCGMKFELRDGVLQACA